MAKRIIVVFAAVSMLLYVFLIFCIRKVIESDRQYHEYMENETY